MTREQHAAYVEWYIAQDEKRRAATSNGTLERQPPDRPTIGAGELDETHDKDRGALGIGGRVFHCTAFAGEIVE